MPTPNGLASLFIVSAGVSILFYIVALVFVIQRRFDRDSAKACLIVGLSLLLIQSVGGIVARVIIAGVTTPDNLIVLAVSSLLSSVLHVAAIAFLVAAAVVGRHRAEAEQRFVSPQADNPYTPPQS